MKATREQTIQRMQQARIGAIIRCKDQPRAQDAMRAAVEGGICVIEFTLNTPGALDLIAEFAKDESLLVGAGTVMNAAQVGEAVAAGAAFIVSPHTNAEVIAETRRHNAISVPGACTPTEMVHAQNLGADLVKLFPAPADIAGFVRQLVGPLPDLRIFPTAGITPENFMAILEAGAFGVGFVSSLFTPEDMQNKNYRAIQQRAAGIVKRLATA